MSEAALLSNFDVVYKSILDQPCSCTTEIANRLGLPRAVVNRNLTTLVRCGLAIGLRNGRTIGYYPKPEARLSLVSPVAPANDAAQWSRLEWTSSVPLDWRFPLASRLPGPALQDAMVEVLERLMEGSAIGVQGPEGHFEVVAYVAPPQTDQRRTLVIIVLGGQSDMAAEATRALANVASKPDLKVRCLSVPCQLPPEASLEETERTLPESLRRRANAVIDKGITTYTSNGWQMTVEALRARSAAPGPRASDRLWASSRRRMRVSGSGRGLLAPSQSPAEMTV